MKKMICCFTLLLMVLACQQDNANAQATPCKDEQNSQQDENVVDGNKHREAAFSVNWSVVKYEEAEQSDTTVSAHRFQLVAADKAEEVSKGVFLVGWIRASLSENECEVQIIPVEMDEPYIYWIQRGLKKDDVNFDGYTDIAVTQHGGAKWGKYFWWVFDPETERFYRNCLTEELSRLTFARFQTYPESKEITIRDYNGTEATDYTYRIVEGHLRQVGLAGLRVEKAKYWRERGYSFDPNSMTAYQMDWKVKDIEMARYWREQGYSFDPNVMNAGQMRDKAGSIKRAKYWRQQGHIFDPNEMTAHQMDQTVRALELDKAEEKYKKSLEVEKRSVRLEGMANAYSNLASVYGNKKELDKAEEMYKKALEINEKLGRLDVMACNYLNSGAHYKKRGDVEKAREHLEKAVDLYKKIGSPLMLERTQRLIEELKD